MSEATSDPHVVRATLLKEEGFEGYTQVYLFQGRVTHLLRPNDTVNGSYPDALCGVWSDPFNPWFGTGCQAEYDEAVKRPLCKKCLKR